MSKLQKNLLALILLSLVAGIMLSWGSIGSAILTLALLLSLCFILLQRFMATHDADDFRMED